MSSKERPLSPHLQVYRPELTSVLSIVHRITGVALSVGLLLLVCWLLAVASGAAFYDAVQAFNAHWFGRILLFGWTFALFYHLCNGIRHLVWDTGHGYRVWQNLHGTCSNKGLDRNRRNNHHSTYHHTARTMEKRD